MAVIACHEVAKMCTWYYIDKATLVLSYVYTMDNKNSPFALFKVLHILKVSPFIML